MVDADTKEPSEEVKKHRSSDISSGNSLIMKTESGLTDNIEGFMPRFQIDLPFSFPTTEIFDIFASSALRKHFQVIEKNSHMATAVCKEGISIKSILLCCLPPEQRQKTILSAVRLHINVNETLCKRIVHVKGIYGHPQIIIPLISEFQMKIESSLTKKLDKETSYENIIYDEEETVVTCKHESSSYYQFHKILSSEAYTLGKTISSFINAFAEQYRNPEESVSMLPLPLDSIKETVEQAVEALFTHYNYGRANSERMMIYCRPAVEKYIYSKVYHILFPIYVTKQLKIDEEINRKRRVCENIENNEIYKRIGMKDVFIVDDNYNEACEILNRIEEFKSPIEKIHCIENAISSLRASVIDYTKGQDEVNEISDEIKILVFIVIKSQFLHPAAQLELIKDYTGFKNDLENKGILNLNAAIHYAFDELTMWVN